MGRFGGRQGKWRINKDTVRRAMREKSEGRVTFETPQCEFEVLSSTITFGKLLGFLEPNVPHLQNEAIALLA